MTKKKKQKPSMVDFITGQVFKSKDELYVSWYLEELKQHGYISKWKYEAKSYILGHSDEQYRKVWYEQLQTKMSEKKSFHSLLQGHVYTPDFHIRFTDKAENIFFCNHDQVTGSIPFILFNSRVSVIEVKFEKGSFQGNKRNTNISRKWLLEKEGVYAEEIHYKDLFFPSFTPKRFREKDNGKGSRYVTHWKALDRLRSLEQYIEVRKQMNEEYFINKQKYIQQ